MVEMCRIAGDLKWEDNGGQLPFAHLISGVH